MHKVRQVLGVAVDEQNGVKFSVVYETVWTVY